MDKQTKKALGEYLADYLQHEEEEKWMSYHFPDHGVLLDTLKEGLDAFESVKEVEDKQTESTRAKDPLRHILATSLADFLLCNGVDFGLPEDFADLIKEGIERFVKYNDLRLELLPEVFVVGKVSATTLRNALAVVPVHLEDYHRDLCSRTSLIGDILYAQRILTELLNEVRGMSTHATAKSQTRENLNNLLGPLPHHEHTKNQQTKETTKNENKNTTAKDRTAGQPPSPTRSTGRSARRDN